MAGEVFLKSSLIKVRWQPDGAATPVDVSGYITDFEWKEDAQETTLEAIAGKQRFVDPADTTRTAKISGYDIVGNPRPDWESPSFALGTKGTLIWMPEDEISGKRRNSAVAYVKGRSAKTNSKNASWDIDFIINGDITYGSV